MTVIHHVLFEGPTMNGEKEIRGKLNIGTYNTSGANVDLSNYFKTATYPTVIISACAGYVLEHDQGTAAAGKVLAYYTSTKNGALGALDQVADSTSLAAINALFIARGQPY